MDKETIRNMILEVLQLADYDLYKSFLPECAEDIVYSDLQMDELIKVVEYYLDEDNEVSSE